MVILQGTHVREVEGKLLRRRNGLVCSCPGQRLRHVSGVRFTAKKDDDGDEEQEKNYKNKDRVFTFLLFRVFCHIFRVSIKVKLSTKPAGKDHERMILLRVSSTERDCLILAFKKSSVKYRLFSLMISQSSSILPSLAKSISLIKFSAKLLTICSTLL